MEAEFENALSSFTGFGNDALSILYFVNTIFLVIISYKPFLLAVIWMFYDETNIMAYYNIKKEHYIFYFIFAFIIIPF